MKLRNTKIPGCYEIYYDLRSDPRGNFLKTFRASEFSRLGLRTSFGESFFTWSTHNVVRGMHFQLPPADGAKLVACLSGHVMDVALDLRRGSPAYGECEILELAEHRAVYIPSGVAHGFYVRQAPSLLAYLVTGEYDGDLDTGVLWNSIGVPWPSSDPIISARDAALPRLQDFQSPFQMDVSGSERHA